MNFLPFARRFVAASVWREETRRVLGERIDENGRHMRVLHEEVIGRLATIQEGQSAPRRGRKDG